MWGIAVRFGVVPLIGGGGERREPHSQVLDTYFWADGMVEGVRATKVVETVFKEHWQKY